MLELIEEYEFLAAFWMTVKLTVYSAFFSLILGTVLAIMRVSPVKIFQFIGTAYVTLFRNTPLTLIVVACSLALWGQLGVELASRDSDTFIVDNSVRLAILGLSVYHAAFVCEALRSGVNTIPLGQAEAARSIGLSFTQSLTQVILPQAVRGAITPLGNVLIALTKNTTVVAAIGVAEIAYRMKAVAEFRPDILLLGFGVVAIAFVILTLPMGMLTSFLSNRLAVKR
ncbi:amino acid ABC transporter permease [Ornithinimicrobium faecis]|uniref:Amino acid ABC transporter permease n=1 Tax=Ornithinimicrobium faecis TaxID=2934158 RepID=A0ABY4YNT8_9MICO|nr:MULTISPECIES: amino acid ABC transporter permease [unclassified Ornithinimicrobium]USQ78445.1 amino acid ABC transporter permease [Ornithinimicrobium sp. HY1793]